MQLTTNTRAFIESEQYSSFILTNLHDGLMPGMWYRNVGDFGAGETLHIKTIGSAVIQEVEEDVPVVYNPIDTGEVFLKITDYVGDAWYITDVLRQDGAQLETLMAQRAAEATRAIQEHFETRYFETCNEAQTNSDANLINGFPHRLAAAGAQNAFTLKPVIIMKLAFDKANVPYAGRVAAIDPVCAATLDTLTTITHDVTAFGEKILVNGFDRDHSFLMDLYGWNIITSNRLDKGDFGGADPGDYGVIVEVVDSVANVFMSILDDNTKPIMTAWRQHPSVEGERNKDRARDEFVTRARWGLGVQRVDTLGIFITSAVNV